MIELAGSTELVSTSVRKRLELGCRKPYLAISHKKRQKPDEAIFRHKPSHNYQIDKNNSFSTKTSIFFPGLDFSELNLTYLDRQNNLKTEYIYASKMIWMPSFYQNY